MSTNHHNAELHVSPSAGGWNIRESSLVVSHNSIDGRTTLYVLDLFYELLVEVLENKAHPTSELRWGEEVSRLPLPAPFVQALLKTGQPPNLSNISSPALPRPSQDDTAPVMVPWTVPPQRLGVKQGEVGNLVKFSRGVTAKLHSVSKRHGRTITQVMTAVTALVLSEALLKISGGRSDERFGALATGFKTATVFPVASNYFNYRLKLSDGYGSLKSGKAAPLLTADSVPLFLSMDGIRKFVKVDETKVDETKKTESHNINLELFWESLVKDAADGWNNVDKFLDAYLTREIVMNWLGNTFDPAPFQIVAPVISSLGDLKRLNILNAYLPSARNPSLTVNDLIFNIRNEFPVIMVLVYQYNGELSLNVCTSAQFSSNEDIGLINGLFEQWVASLSD